jgi:N-acyl-phosphatidylethanolamine-hydrolysing phospholipase D
MLTAGPIIPQDVEKLLKLQTPTWGKDAKKGDLKATWLGHACFLVELPTPEGASRGPRILFDPAFSNRCSPSAYFGPARYTSAISSLPLYPTDISKNPRVLRRIFLKLMLL